MENKLFIAPSILSADFGDLNADIADVAGKGSDVLHIDAMDGHFVPNLSFGAPVVKWIKTEMPKHCHLMVSNPETMISDFVKAGAETIIFHIEAVADIAAARVLIEEIKSHGVKAGISIKPDTGVDAIVELMDDLDEVLVMSVEPGFGGQSFMPVALEKIAELRKLRADMIVSVDGGINAETGKLARDAGANLLVAGSYIFKAENREAAIQSLRG